MNKIALSTAAAVVAVLTMSISAPVMAATAHNSQAGGLGPSSNPTSSTVSSPRVKHAAKHHKHP